MMIKTTRLEKVRTITREQDESSCRDFFYSFLLLRMCGARKKSIFFTFDSIYYFI